MSTKAHSFEGGKYTVIEHDDGSMEALRYGEPWRDLTGDKLIGAMLAALEEAEGKRANGNMILMPADKLAVMQAELAAVRQQLAEARREGRES